MMSSPTATRRDNVPKAGLRLDEIVSAIRQEYLSEEQNYPWIIGFSGGKDSTLVAHAVIDALLDIAPTHRTREVHILSNDTLVESPLVMAYLREVQSQLRDAARHLRLPVVVATTRPDPEQTFWVLLIGRGYPTPNQNMRWCTDRLKILPTSRYILESVSRHGAAILVLGVRKDESSTRRQTIVRHRNLAHSNLTPHSSLNGALIYRPIVNLTTDEVWEILGEHPPPWGGTHQALIQLYRDAEGGECPVVLSKAEAPGCGTNSSRFGCWTCTVVEKDKSLQGFIDSGQHHYLPLVAFRDWLKSIRNEPAFRQAARRNGRISYDATGRHIPGPFTIQARRMILDRLLQTQAEFGAELISADEIQSIKRIWTEDLLKT
jgi:DNA sulfur modification protein DndC